VSLLGEQYDVVATQRWEKARAAAAQQTHGPSQWSKAAKQSGVDAVIEGWIQDEGRRKILNIVVRAAVSGREFDPISVRLDGKNGISTESTQKLRAGLDEVLDWIDAGNDDAVPVLPVVSVSTKRPGAVTPIATSLKPSDADRVEAETPAEAPPKRRAKRVSLAFEVSSETSAARPTPPPPPPPPPATDDSDPPAAAPPAHEARPAQVSTADREAHEIEVLFPQHSEERKQLLGAEADHVPVKTPRFMIDAGGYLGSRNLTWEADPEANVVPLAGAGIKGFQVNAAVYPFPTKPVDGVMSGFGFTGSIHHSAGSSIEFDNLETIEAYSVNENGWELGVHYRFPLSGLVALDGGAFYGNQTFEIIDAAAEFEIPDTKYSYLGASAHLDLSITDRALIGFGARYFTVLDAGDLASVDWYGPVDASGLGLEATFQIPLPANLYVRGQLAYQRIALELSGGGQITDDEGVTRGKDSLITGNVNLGIAF
jgi:hypothetical protein